MAWSYRWSGCIIAGAALLLGLSAPDVRAEEEVQALVVRGPEVTASVNYRPGQEVPADRLGEFLQRGFSVAIEGGREAIEATLTIEMIARESGLVGKSESRPARLRPGTKTSGASLIPQLDHWVPGMSEWVSEREGRFVLGRTIRSRNGGGMPRECDDASHAARLTLNAVGERAIFDSPLVCMNWRP